MPGVIHLLLGDRCYQRPLGGIRLCALPAASRGRHRQPIWACTPEDGRFNGPTCILSGLSRRLSPSAFSGAPQPLHRHPASGRVVCSLFTGFCSRAKPLGLRLAALGSHDGGWNFLSALLERREPPSGSPPLNTDGEHLKLNFSLSGDSPSFREEIY